MYVHVNQRQDRWRNDICGIELLPCELSSAHHPHRPEWHHGNPAPVSTPELLCWGMFGVDSISDRTASRGCTQGTGHDTWGTRLSGIYNFVIFKIKLLLVKWFNFSTFLGVSVVSNDLVLIYPAVTCVRDGLNNKTWQNLDSGRIRGGVCRWGIFL